MRRPKARAGARACPLMALFPAALGFLAGMVVMAAVVRVFPAGAAIMTTRRSMASVCRSAGRTTSKWK